MTQYNVLRPHTGDKFYAVGDTREAKPADVVHLVQNGVLSECKAAPTPAPEAKNTNDKKPSPKR